MVNKTDKLDARGLNRLQQARDGLELLDRLLELAFAFQSALAARRTPRVSRIEGLGLAQGLGGRLAPVLAEEYSSQSDQGIDVLRLRAERQERKRVADALEALLGRLKP